MRVAVITPYHQEPHAWLTRCIDSVTNQSHAVTHFLIADGYAQDWIDDLPVRHLRLDHAHNDYGNTPRGLGALLAVSEGFDAIAFLDADNWFTPNHIELCVTSARSTPNLDFVIAQRHMVREDGSIMPIDIPEDHFESGPNHVDTNCYFLLRGSFHALSRWVTMPKALHPVGDRVFWKSLQNDQLSFATTTEPSINYLCTYAYFFLLCGEVPPAYAKTKLSLHKVHDWLSNLNQRDIVLTRRSTGIDLSLTAPEIDSPQHFNLKKPP